MYVYVYLSIYLSISISIYPSIYLSIYLYIHAHTYVYTYTHIYTLRCTQTCASQNRCVLGTCPVRDSTEDSKRGGSWPFHDIVITNIGWPIHDILSRLCFCARINHPFIASPTCIAHTVAILLQYYCAIFDPLPTPRFHVIHPTILLMTISCKGQNIVWCIAYTGRGRWGGGRILRNTHELELQ